MESEIVLKAKELAIKAHSKKTYGSLPYEFHLKAVADFVENMFPEEEDYLAAAWLHDIIEDTYIEYEHLEKKFGTRIAELVYAVTDERGRTREEKKRKTYPKIYGNQGALIIKLADRICNVRYSVNTQNRMKTLKYFNEQEDFNKALFKNYESPRTLQEKKILTMWGLLANSF
jgi:(p)ppGpp synthase/HD superfamily hydrolase